MSATTVRKIDKREARRRYEAGEPIAIAGESWWFDREREAHTITQRSMNGATFEELHVARSGSRYSYAAPVETTTVELPLSLVRVCSSMPYGAAAGRVPADLEGLETWLTGLRSVLAGVARESEQTGAALRELEQQRAAVRAFLGTES